ncbi:putative bifunctional diguanylate cyclase/phosphodiesterase [Phenylobacterium sp.]|jgi:EAL domain-containing protein (putative c-di-GMP-specific phosphodiesterase class I)/CHASE2 domain-containing sensor protein|uniref:putative bifunctional diguanylate cyclase/phosphodiesterase n=1 Tax=Phenylobacterium sp. TaxID=1871053 RepID=UPI002F9509E5
MRLPWTSRAADDPAAPRDWAGLAKRAAGLVATMALVAAAQLAGLLQPLDDGLAELRFEWLRRPASQSLAVVEIDTASLRAAGQWPWSRARYAQAIENLQAAGAGVVAFDVDFSAPSSAQADARLAAAVRAVPGAVVLPTFVQQSSLSPRGDMVESMPLAAMSDEAVLASVNVPVDRDGRVRRYAYGFEGGEGVRPAIGALLAGSLPGGSGSFLLDYGIRVEQAPRVSFEDVYSNRFDPALVRGRSVLIGATALELGDEFATPRFGTLPGVYVHALAYESMRAGRDLKRLHPYAMLAIAGLVAFLLRPRGLALSFRRLLARHLAVASGAVAASFLAQALLPLTLDIASVLSAQVLMLIWTVRSELQRRAAEIVREREAGLLHLALHEPETELPNRRALTAELAARMQTDAAVAVVAVGIDRYPTMRGAVGYGLANQVVRAMAERLAKVTGEAGVAHLSTSVLGLVLSAPSRAELGERLQQVEQLDPGYQIDDHAVDVFVRLGIAHRLRAEDTAERLLEDASIALDRARQTHRRSVAFDASAFVDPSMNLALMSDMRNGLRRGEFELHYQPKVCPVSGRLAGLEALIRWTHPVRGSIAPDDFIPAAEETGNIRAVTEWGLDRLLADRAKLRAAGHSINLALNVSPLLLSDGSFLERALKAVRRDPRDLTFEITETAVVRSPEAAMSAIRAYRTAGVKIAIDDYGTGLSSLAYLKMIKADELKLDKSLVGDAATAERDRLILRSTIELAHSLDMAVVAEGVEDEAVRQALAELGCDAIQGFLVARALPLDEVLARLDREAAEPAAA